jgi:hypothetical protein
MKRSLRLSALVVLYLLFSAKSCDQQEEFDGARQQRATEAAKDSIVSVFGSDTLTALTLTAFEETAKLKFADLFDYLDILSDTSAAPAFKEQAGQMARELFISEYSFPRFARPDSIWVMEHLHRVSDSLLTGRLGFSPNGSVGFLALKRNKIFGTDTLKVWNVLLGEIDQNDH